jgi:N-acetylglucosaminylphosphatidylinositol deacetylase
MSYWFWFLVLYPVIYYGVLKLVGLRFGRDQSVAGKNLGSLRNILLVIAHPDDETMFFMPLIEKLKKQKAKINVLCLSNGGFDGLGKIREKEFRKSMEYLKVDKSDVLDVPELPDGMKYSWDSAVVSDTVLRYTKKWKIDGIVTFDSKGISGHPNHIDVHRGVKVAMKSFDGPVFELETVNIFLKYVLPPIDLLIATGKNLQSRYTVINDEEFLIWKGMVVYATQNVWFRRLFAIFSRYGFINTLREIS